MHLFNLTKQITNLRLPFLPIRFFIICGSQALYHIVVKGAVINILIISDGDEKCWAPAVDEWKKVQRWFLQFDWESFARFLSQLDIYGISKSPF